MVNGSKNLVYLFHRIQLSKKRNELLIYPITCMNLLRVTLCEKASTERLHATSVRCSVVKSCLTFCDPMDCRPPRACSNSCPLSRWYHPTISSSVIPFSSSLQSFPAPGSFPMNQTCSLWWPKYWSFSFNISPSNEH